MTSMKKLIIGLDLSFSSTGITFISLTNNIPISIIFNRIMLDKEKTKKQFVPNSFRNVNDILYRLPKNITTEDLIFDADIANNYKQITVTLKALMATRVITKQCSDIINRYSPDEIFVGFENYVLPTFSGPTALDNVSGLIMLQGYVRKFFIDLYIANKTPTKIFTEPPKTIKHFFTKNGNAEKHQMVGTFINEYEGNKLIPGLEVSDTEKINDIVDSFAVASYIYKKIFNL